MSTLKVDTVQANSAAAVTLNDAVEIAQTLDVTGTTTLDSTLTVTGASTLTGAVTANTFASSGATITGGSVTGITDLAVADGGTGASTAAGARTNLDVPSNSEAILDTIMDAKGDLIAGSAADTPTKLTVGANSTVLLADSNEATGLKWANEATFKSELNLEADTDFRRPLVLGTEVATTSGTTADFTSIPSGVKRITLMLDGVSFSGSPTGNLLVQIGDSGGIETTGYSSCASVLTTVVSTSASTAGFIMTSGGPGASIEFSGQIILSLEDSTNNTWVASGGIMYTGTPVNYIFGGKKSLSATLDRIRLTSTTGETFDAGAINIQYEF